MGVQAVLDGAEDKSGFDLLLRLERLLHEFGHLGEYSFLRQVFEPKSDLAVVT